MYNGVVKQAGSRVTRHKFLSQLTIVRMSTRVACNRQAMQGAKNNLHQDPE